MTSSVGSSATVALRVSEAGLSEFNKTHVMPYLVQVGNRVMNNSAARVPVDTGYLRSTRTLTEDPSRTAVQIAYRARYAIFVHQGTRFMQGRPFLTDALREEVSRL